MHTRKGRRPQPFELHTTGTEEGNGGGAGRFSQSGFFVLANCGRSTEESGGQLVIGVGALDARGRETVGAGELPVFDDCFARVLKDCEAVTQNVVFSDKFQIESRCRRIIA
jgi:hypothetical protein